MTGKPPANMSLEPKPSGYQYIVKGSAIDKCEWNATYNCKKHGEDMELELDVSNGTTGKAPANMYLSQNHQETATL